MILMPIVYVTDMERSIEFYESLGLEVDAQATSRVWTELKAGDRAVLALHAAESLPEPSKRVELTFVAEEGLEEVERRYRDVVARPPTDEAFGRSMVIRDPDGLELWINEHDRTLYATSESD